VKTFPIKKRINTELFIDRKGGFIYKSKGGIWSARSDQEITGLLEEGKKHWQEITVAGAQYMKFFLLFRNVVGGKVQFLALA